jgi:hypothetical protein
MVAAVKWSSSNPFCAVAIFLSISSLSSYTLQNLDSTYYMICALFVIAKLGLKLSTSKKIQSKKERKEGRKKCFCFAAFLLI